MTVLENKNDETHVSKGFKGDALFKNAMKNQKFMEKVGKKLLNIDKLNSKLSDIVKKSK